MFAGSTKGHVLLYAANTIFISRKLEGFVMLIRLNSAVGIKINYSKIKKKQSEVETFHFWIIDSMAAPA